MIKSLLIALIAGALLPLAFAPVNIFALAFIMPAILLYLWLKATPARAFWIGLAFGLAMFGVGSSWIYISVHNFGNATPPLAAFLTGLLILLMSCYPAIQGYILRKLWRHKSDTIICLCAFPASWVILEYIRSFLFDGFPFLFLGYSQSDNLLNGLAPIFGVYGLSLVVTLISGALVLLLKKTTPPRQKFLGIIVIALCVCLGWSYHNRHWTKPASKPIQISMIQGNIPQQMKWNSADLTKIINKYRSLTNQHWQSQLIIWPEAAVPFFPDQLPEFFNSLNKDAIAHQATLIIGAPLANKQTKTYNNGLLMLGNNHGHYKKRHLVPFGEFIPLQSIFGPLMKDLDVPMSNLSPGPKQQPTLMFNGIPIAAYICYETAFPIETLNEMKDKQLAINIVDDAWFGHSFAMGQQLQMTQMRALETGRYIAITSNTGITALINPLGRVTSQLPIDTTDVLTVKPVAMSGNTPLMRSNYYSVLAIIFLLLLLSIRSKTCKTNKR